jgi:hypothetical protein
MNKWGYEPRGGSRSAAAHGLTAPGDGRSGSHCSSGEGDRNTRLVWWGGWGPVASVRAAHTPPYTPTHRHTDSRPHDRVILPLPHCSPGPQPAQLRRHPARCGQGKLSTRRRQRGAGRRRVAGSCSRSPPAAGPARPAYAGALQWRRLRLDATNRQNPALFPAFKSSPNDYPRGEIAGAE